MDENNNKAGEQLFRMPESVDVEGSELREISKEELKKILEDHEKWIKSEGKEGKKADLGGANLQKAELGKVNLQNAYLAKANLQNAKLLGANFKEANLLGAQLKAANLWGTNFQKAHLAKANLQEANLRGANLQEADLGGANLQKSKLVKATLQKANFWGTNLQEANLRGANLQEATLIIADLNGAILHDTNLINASLNGVKGLAEAELQYANLEGTTGLLGNEFAQANLTGTKLPENIKDFETLKIVEETSKNARKLFFAMLLGCVYSWLTIATTTDVRLLTNSSSSPLPIIGTEIPIAWFYWAAPLVIMCFYLYLHYYLNGLWEALSGLPAIFPDGKRLDERAYPWLLNKLVRRHFKLLRENRPFIAHQQEWIIIFLAWWAVPMTLIGFWLRYLPRHDWFGTCLHIGLLVGSFAAATWFYRLASIILMGFNIKTFRWQNFWREKVVYQRLGILLTGILVLVISDGAINGIRWKENGDEVILRNIDLTNSRELIPYILRKLGYEPFADFREKDVSERPANFLLIKSEERIDSIKGANLRGRNLKYADMRFSLLTKAELQGADLQYAKLGEANLNSAKLMFANIDYADLSSAKFQKANLSEASIKNADLSKADLWKAELLGVNLQEANLYSARLEDARLVSSYLKNANLKYAISNNADLIGSDLSGANLSYANFSNAIFKEADLQNAILVETNLNKADLNYASLANANLSDAYLGNSNLRGANLMGANLQGTILFGSDLEGVKNLSIEQLSKVATLYGARLNPELMSKIELNYPNLLEKP